MMRPAAAGRIRRVDHAHTVVVAPLSDGASADMTTIWIKQFPAGAHAPMHPPSLGLGREAGAAMMIWINGAFGADKTTLAEELHRRLPDALAFDPEYLGYVLREWVPSPEGGDFQDIPLWRKLVAEFALGMSAEYGRTLIIPMTLVNPLS
jgi:hypothetical protein